MTETPDDLISQAITEAFGERCPEYGEWCPCCQAWKQSDDLKARFDWRDISTAPKTGEPFLTAGRNEVCVAYWDNDWNQFFSVPGRYGVHPCHWMPLPSPPSKEPSNPKVTV